MVTIRKEKSKPGAKWQRFRVLGIRAAILNRVVKAGLTKKVALEQSPEGRQEVDCACLWKKSSLNMEEMAKARDANTKFIHQKQRQGQVT